MTKSKSPNNLWTQRSGHPIASRTVFEMPIYTNLIYAKTFPASPALACLPLHL